MPLYLVLRYHDREGFQAALKLLFDPGPEWAPPPVWQAWRLPAGALLIALVAVRYGAVWSGYREAVRLHRSAWETSQAPAASPVLAAYVYRQDPVACFVAWLVLRCREGALALRHTDGARPWTLVRGAQPARSAPDRTVVDTLFRSSDSVEVRAILSDPQPDVRDAVAALHATVRGETRDVFRPRPGVWLALVLVAATLAEIPPHLASLPDVVPGALALIGFCAALYGLLAYVACDQLPLLVDGPSLVARLRVGGAAVFFLIGHVFAAGPLGADVYASSAVLPALAVTLLVVVWRAPRLPREGTLLSAIVGYRKHLGSAARDTAAEDLPWTLGLGVHADLFGGTFRYAGGSPPDWLLTAGGDPQEVLRLLHQTLAENVREATHGKIRSRRRSHGRSGAGGA